MAIESGDDALMLQELSSGPRRVAVKSLNRRMNKASLFRQTFNLKTDHSPRVLERRSRPYAEVFASVDVEFITISIPQSKKEVL